MQKRDYHNIITHSPNSVTIEYIYEEREDFGDPWVEVNKDVQPGLTTIHPDAAIVIMEEAKTLFPNETDKFDTIITELEAI